MTDYLPALARIADDQCGRPWTWVGPEGGETGEVRDGLYRCLEEELQAAAEVGTGTESSRLLASAQEAFGDLRGILGPLDDSWLDRPPREGEWPLRSTLRHILESELTYRANTVHALGRGANDPLVVPHGDRPRVAEAEVSGTLRDILERMAFERTLTDRLLGEIPARLLTRPTLWAGFHVDVRFRLGRFAGHLVEHTVQVEKTLAALAHHPGEAALIVRRISAARGRHEHLSGSDRIVSLDAHHGEVLRAAIAQLPHGSQ